MASMRRLVRCQRVGPTIPGSVGRGISDDADQASVAVPSMKMAVRVLSQAAPRKRATLASRPSVVVWPFVLDPCDPLSR
jgi:hypothetical protein